MHLKKGTLLPTLLSVIFIVLSVLPAYSQQLRKVTGRVVDETDAPVAGAYIVVKGETRGVMTDNDGRFNIDVSSRDVLVASFLGYEDEEMAVREQNEVIFKLVPVADRLDEAIAVAYGTQRKASVIGSISTVQMEQLASPMGQISTGLAGKLAGVVAMQRTGEPGASAEFWIRGVNTFGANSKPLILVDGVEREMDLVDVEDIASFSILKDATATALYGVRGANGIVLITTRRGAETKPKVNIKLETGFTSPVKLPEMADTEQFIDYVNALYTENGSEAPISEIDKGRYLDQTYDPYLYPSVDWVNSIFKRFAQTHRINMNVTGGTKNIRYYVGGSYYFEDGILNTADNDRYNSQMNFQKFNFRSNVDINITRSTILGLSLSTQYTTKNSPGRALTDILNYTMINTPIVMPLVYPDNVLSEVKNTNNPYNYVNESGFRTIKRNTAQSTISLTQDFSEIITEGLQAKIQMSWDAWNETNLNRGKVPPTYSATGRDADGNLEYIMQDDYKGYMTLTSTNKGWNSLNLEASVLYERVLASAHRVSGMLLFSMRTRDDNVPDHKVRGDEKGDDYLESFPYRNMGLAGRATYSFKDRYFTEFNFGYNGSENFSPGHRFGFFPSFALGYMISNEPFWDGIKSYVNELKFKASWGKIGNDQIGGERRFVYNTTMNTSTGTGANWGKEEAIYLASISTGQSGNPNVGWEEAMKFNAGFELGLFGKVSYMFDFFYDRRSGIFLPQESLPSAVGVLEQKYVNVGQMENSGIDMTLQYDQTFAGGFNLSAKATYTFNRNRRIFDDKPDQIWKYQNTAGFVNNQQRGLIAAGLFTSQEDIDTWPKQSFGVVKPGDIKYVDVNDDGVVDVLDVVPIGYTTVPEINYGFGLSMSWKGIDFSFFFNGVGHVTRIIGGTNFWGGTSTTALQSGQIYKDVALHHWTTDNPDPNAKYPRLSLAKAENNSQNSTFWQRDMSFLRMKNIELGYTLPKKWTKRAGMSAVRFYVQGVNLLTFSKFKLWDPELDANYGNVYPMTKNISLGVNVNF
ncbi:MAG: TonB-dependent receptor [Bacteroidales bacterium]|nr:TonB-dependent receptor [Bacteroidales bacterium]